MSLKQREPTPEEAAQTQRMCIALDDVLASVDTLTIAEKDVVLEAARYSGDFYIIAGPTTNPNAHLLLNEWRAWKKGEK